MNEEQMELYELIADYFLFVHDEATYEWIYSGKRNTRTFNKQHDANWRRMESELKHHGLLTELEAL